MKFIVHCTLFLACLAQPVFAKAINREANLIAHLEKSILLGEAENSKLIPEILNIPGMSSPKVRHFLNNLCSLPGTSYLEVGVWQGSTFISALFGNEDTISHSVGLDNWSQFGGPFSPFISNLTTFIPTYKGKFFSADCFSINKKTVFSAPVNIYFYDGDHSFTAQKMAFTFFNDVLDDLFIAVVDDWNYDAVREGTDAAFRELNYEILYESILPARFAGDKQQWWNGLYVAVIRKPRKS